MIVIRPTLYPRIIAIPRGVPDRYIPIPARRTSATVDEFREAHGLLAVKDIRCDRCAMEGTIFLWETASEWHTKRIFHAAEVATMDWVIVAGGSCRKLNALSMDVTETLAPV